MIDLTDENDPYLFAATTPEGHRAIFQWLEVTSSIADVLSAATTTDAASIATIVGSMRKNTRTPDALTAVADAWLWGVFVRMSETVTKAGKEGG